MMSIVNFYTDLIDGHFLFNNFVLGMFEWPEINSDCQCCCIYFSMDALTILFLYVVHNCLVVCKY